MKEYLIAAALVLAAMVGMYFMGQRSAEVKYTEHIQEAAIKQLKIDASATTAAYARLEKLKVAEAIHKEKVNAATSKALSENPDWADERVPDSVIDAIGM